MALRQQKQTFRLHAWGIGNFEGAQWLKMFMISNWVVGDVMTNIILLAIKRSNELINQMVKQNLVLDLEA